MIEEIKSFFPKRISPECHRANLISICLFRILRCAINTEYCPGWVIFAQRIYSPSVVMMATRTTIPACSVMKTSKYTSCTITPSHVEILDYTFNAGRANIKKPRKGKKGKANPWNFGTRYFDYIYQKQKQKIYKLANKS